jgi:SAM-dependent methyltransferase
MAFPLRLERTKGRVGIEPIGPRFYEKYGIEWSSTDRRSTEAVVNSYKVFHLCSLMEGLRPKRILDFGCGLGDALDLLCMYFDTRDAIGIDISSTMIDYAQKAHPQYSFVQGGIEDFKNFRVDLVTFIDVLEHLEDIPTVLEVAKTYSDYIAIKIPLEKTWFIHLLNSFHLKERRSRLYLTEGHLYEFNRADVESILKEAGLTILKKKTAFIPKEVLFSVYMRNRMKTKSGCLARLKYNCYLALSKLPYTISRPLFRVANGVDFFVLCKS